MSRKAISDISRIPSSNRIVRIADGNINGNQVRRGSLTVCRRADGAKRPADPIAATQMKIPPQTSLNRGSLNLDDKFEVKHWTTQWGVTVEDLRRAMDKVGPSVHAIAKELGKSDDLEAEHRSKQPHP